MDPVITLAEQLLHLGELSWYAAYTRANHEKAVARQLGLRSIECFLPLYKKVNRWKDRSATIQLPLFPGYVFVRTKLAHKLRILEVPGVVRLVGFNGLPAALPDADMEIMRAGLSQNVLVEPHPFLKAGQRVRVTAGPFAGLEGILRRKKNDVRVVVSIDAIQRAIAVEIGTAELEVITRTVDRWVSMRPKTSMRSRESARVHKSPLERGMN